jgi:hypothetical protein
LLLFSTIQVLYNTTILNKARRTPGNLRGPQ